MTKIVQTYQNSVLKQEENDKKIKNKYPKLVFCLSAFCLEAQFLLAFALKIALGFTPATMVNLPQVVSSRLNDNFSQIWVGQGRFLLAFLLIA